MNITSVRRIHYALLVCLLAGCAGAAATPQSQSAPLTAARPTQIVVYPFAVDPGDVTLNQSIIQRTYRNMSGEDENAQQVQLAHETADHVCHDVVAGLIAKGHNAVCQNRGVPPVGSNLLIVDGQFTNISEGNRLRRLVIGFGAGSAILDTSVQMYNRSAGSSRQVLTFTTHADSGMMPGAAVTAGAGAAAGGSAAVIVGANAGIGGVKTITSSTGFLANKTASEIVDSINTYMTQQGWAPAAQ